MGEITKIEWTEHTFNPWWGCARVSPGCRFCYADRDASRYGFSLWRRHGERRMLSDANWAKPIKWNRDAERAGVPAKVFCASMADVFEDHPALPEPRNRLWRLIEATPWLTWQLLTKRPENIAGMAPWDSSWPSNVWLGTSVENNRFAWRIDTIRSIPAAVRFLSCEPLIGPLDLSSAWAWSPYLAGEIDWVICGGESGPKARPMHPEWARSLRDQCAEREVPFLFKQWGEWAPHTEGGVRVGDICLSEDGDRFDVEPDYICAHNESEGAWMRRVGKRAAGRLLDGRTWDEYPT